MEGGKANRYAALQGGEGGGSKFCQKVRYVTVERSQRSLFKCRQCSKFEKNSKVIAAAAVTVT